MDGVLAVINMLGNTITALQAQVQQLQQTNADLEERLKQMQTTQS